MYHRSMPSDSARVLVTGGTGLIGSELTAELAAAGYEVVVLTRSPESVEELPAGARAVGWDAETADGWGAEAEGALAVVNLAGEGIASGPWTEEKKRSIRRSRLDATAAVVEAFERASAPPAVLLQGSAVGYYGDRGDERLTEEASAGGGFLADVTVAWETASEPVEATGARRCLLRTGVVLSTEGGALPRMALPFKLFVGGPVGDGSQWVPWIHHRDEVRAIRFLLETEAASGPFNLTAPEPATNAELSRALADALHRPSFLRAPRFALQTVLGEMAQMVLTSQRVLPERLLELGFSFEHPQVDGALESLYR